MSFFVGDISLRVGDVDPKIWILRHGVNNDPFDFTGTLDIKIRFESRLDGTNKVFSLITNPTQVIIVGALTDGTLKFIPLITDFTNDNEIFDFYVDIIDIGGPHSFAQGFEYKATVQPKFGI